MLGKIFGSGPKINNAQAKKIRKLLQESQTAVHQQETFSKTEDTISQDNKDINILREFADKKSQLIGIRGKNIDIITFDENGEVIDTQTESKKAEIEDIDKSFEFKLGPQGAWQMIEKDNQSHAQVTTTLSEGHSYKGKVEVPGKKKLTVLFWGNGSGNLEPLVVRKLLDLEKMGSTEDINILAQISRAPQEKIKEQFGEEFVPSDIDGNWSNQARRYYVTKGVQEENPPRIITKETIDSPILENRGDVDMGDKNELSDFLIKGMKDYPAEHYMVVLFDHGLGWRGINPGTDDLGSMNPEDLGEVTKKVKDSTGQNIDVMVMENCLSGQAEALYPMKDNTDFIVASPEIMWGSAFTKTPGPLHIREGLEMIQENKKNELNNPGQAAVDLLQASANKNHAITASLINPKRLDDVASATKELRESLEKSGVTHDKLQPIADKSQNYELLDDAEHRHGYVDLADFAGNIKKETETLEIKKAAEKLEKAVDSSVMAKLTQKGEELKLDSDDGEAWNTFPASVERCRGLSINFGIPGSESEKDLYDSLSFNIATGWNTFVEKSGD